MQTIDLIRTANWIVQQYAEPTRELLRGAYSVDFEMRRHPEAELHAAMDIAIVAERLAQNEAAVAILEAFELSMLTDRSFAMRLSSLATQVTAERMVRPEREDRHESPPRMEINDTIRHLASRWGVLEKFIAPV